MERYGKALEAFQHAVCPAEAHSNLAFTLTTQGKREEAKQAYRQALAMEPNLLIARQALAKLEQPDATKAGAGQSPPHPGPRRGSTAGRVASRRRVNFRAAPPNSIVVPEFGERRGEIGGG